MASARARARDPRGRRPRRGRAAHPRRPARAHDRGRRLPHRDAAGLGRPGDGPARAGRGRGGARPGRRVGRAGGDDHPGRRLLRRVARRGRRARCTRASTRAPPAALPRRPGFLSSLPGVPLGIARAAIDELVRLANEKRVPPLLAHARRLPRAGGGGRGGGNAQAGARARVGPPPEPARPPDARRADDLGPRRRAAEGVRDGGAALLGIEAPLTYTRRGRRRYEPEGARSARSASTVSTCSTRVILPCSTKIAVALPDALGSGAVAAPASSRSTG